MKFKIKREEFISVLSDYASILKENSIKPILSALFMEAKENELVFMGSSMEMDYKKQIQCEGMEAGAAAFKPALVLEYVKLLEEEWIIVEKLDGFLKIANGEFAILEEENYPKIVELASMSLLQIQGNEFAKYLETVKFSSAQTPENLALNCIRVVFGKEKINFVSTDSYRLLYLEKKIAAQFERAISLPLEAVNVIIKLLKEKTEVISLELSGENLLLLWEGTYFSCRLTAVPYPNFQGILNQNFFDKKMEFCLEDLKAAMKRVITVAKTSIDAKYGGTFDFKGKQLVVKAVTTGRAKTQQKVAMMKEGDDFIASLNCKYLSEFLDTISKNVIIYGKNSSSMFRVTEEGNEELIYILMPLALREV